MNVFPQPSLEELQCADFDGEFHFRTEARWNGRIYRSQHLSAGLFDDAIHTRLEPRRAMEYRAGIEKERQRIVQIRNACLLADTLGLEQELIMNGTSCEDALKRIRSEKLSNVK